ncbi:hypothetical protein CVIRNUC_005682 [Coccomyxa viridis]|uniref:Extracellular protein n=1 Tax=Coccomyxa viridis TaxID=1274662 RepID=A0AAV1I8E6_9CHLO|nr:hypothetical protein CVIRNUC_005682 [Coccomyxa viridis]
MKLSQSARHICLLLLAELIAISAVGSYVQVKFYYKENPQRIGPSLASFIAEDGSCSPCTDLNTRGNTWGSYKITEGPLDTFIILFDSSSCHGDTSG